jgi:hypothetical protein
MVHNMKLIILNILSVFVATLLTPLGVVHADEQPVETYPSVLISEVMRSPSGSSERFVELYNPYDEPIDITGWKLQYKPAEGGTWSNRLASTQPTEAPYVIEPGGFFLIGTTAFVEAHPELHVGLLLNGSAVGSDSGGHIRLLSDTDEPSDIVGWGEADSPSGLAAPLIEQGSSITRCFNEAGFIVNSGDNATDFSVNEVPLPGLGIGCQQPEDEPNPDLGADPQPEPEPGDEETTEDEENQEPENPETILNECQGLILTEIGANLDNTEQFIEVFNGNEEAVAITGCQLQTNRSTTKTYVFDEVQLQSGEYLAIYIKDTQLTLTKTTTGTVYLLSEGAVEVDTRSYENLKATTSWALLSTGEWKQTYAPTPGKPNVWKEFPPCPAGQVRNPDSGRCVNIVPAEEVLKPCLPHQVRNPETNRCRNVTTAANTLKPCGPGEERNPQTNRCRKIVSSSSTLVPCKPGQERNPLTNRCRSVLSASSTLVPCKPGQERNPLTNRCRNIQTANTLKPCGPGEERNPETNRCRKIVSVGNVSNLEVQDIEAASGNIPAGWWLAGGAVLFATGYAVWEWRHDISNLGARLRKKFSTSRK